MEELASQILFLTTYIFAHEALVVHLYPYLTNNVHLKIFDLFSQLSLTKTL